MFSRSDKIWYVHIGLESNHSKSKQPKNKTKKKFPFFPPSNQFQTTSACGLKYYSKHILANPFRSDCCDQIPSVFITMSLLQQTKMRITTQTNRSNRFTCNIMWTVNQKNRILQRSDLDWQCEANLSTLILSCCQHVCQPWKMTGSVQYYTAENPLQATCLNLMIKLFLWSTVNKQK